MDDKAQRRHWYESTMQVLLQANKNNIKHPFSSIFRF